jgi:hypothetical protein
MKFSTHLLATGGNNTGIPVPHEVVDELGGGRRPAVHVTVNGYSYRSTVASMGGRYLIPFSAEWREQTGIAGGDPIEVGLTPDTAPRTVEPPADPAEALAAAPGAADAFRALLAGRQQALVASLDAARTATTGQRRIAKAAEDLRAR